MIQETFPMIIGEEEMKNERQLLTVEDGPLMQGRESVRYLIPTVAPHVVTKTILPSNYFVTIRPVVSGL